LGYQIVSGVNYIELSTGVAFAPRRTALSDEDFSSLFESIHETARDVEQLAAGVTGTVQELSAVARALRERLSEVQSSQRTSFMITLGSAELRLAQPLPIELSPAADGVVAHAPDLEVFGSGPTDYEALDDLRRVIAEEYAYLKEHESELGPLPKRQLARFREIIVGEGGSPL
jgi:hypothetical protein